MRFFREILRLLIEPTVPETPPAVATVGSHRGYVEIPMKYSTAEQIPLLKLEEIYRREFHSAVSKFQSHRAEDDCLMLLALLKLYLADWLEWTEENARPLREFNHLPQSSPSPPKQLIAPPEKKVKRPLKF